MYLCRSKPLVVFVLLVFMLSSFATNALAFTDTDSHWAAQQINKWESKGLVHGYADGTFLPNKEITRGEFLELLNRVLTPKISRQVLFNTVFSREYIGDNSKELLHPNESITREETATIISKIVDLPEGNQSDLSNFTDENDISEWAINGIKTLTANNIMKGYPDGTFRPQKTLSRAETIVILDNVLEIVKAQFTGIKGVVNQEDTTAANVVVKLYEKDSNEPISETTTNSLGEYRFEVSEGTYHILAEKNGYLAYADDLIVQEGKTTTQNLILAKGVKATGVLRNSFGAMLSNTKLIFKSHIIFQSTTNPQGEISLFLLPNYEYEVLSIDVDNESEVYKTIGRVFIGEEDQDLGDLYTPYPVIPTSQGSSPTLPTVSKPVASPNGGDVILGRELTLTTTTQDASIRYTFGDGSQASPTANTGEIYDENNKPILNVTGVYKVKAFKTGMKPSEELTVSFTVLNSITGTAFDSEDNPLVNTVLTFTTEEDSYTVETDSSGYFATHIKPSTIYDITGEGLSVSVINRTDGFELTNNVGKIVLGKVFTLGENKVIYNTGANYLHENLAPKISYDESTGKVTLAEHMDFLVGDVIVLPPTEEYLGGMALKIVGISTEGETMILDTISPEFEEIFSSIKGTTSDPLSPEHFEPAEGVEIIREEPPMDSMDIMTDGFEATELNRITSLNINLGSESSNWQVTGKLELDGSVNGDIDWALEWDLMNSCYFDIQARQVLAVEGKFTSNSADRFVVQIGTYHIPTSIPGITVSVPIQLVFIPEGKITVKIGATLNEHVGVRYDDGHGVRVYPEDKFQADITEPELTLSGGCKLGVRLPNAIAGAGKRIAGIQIESGGYLELTSTPTASLCGTVEYGYYGEAALTLNILDWVSPAIEQKIAVGSKQVGNCGIDDLRIIPQYLELFPGECKTFTIQARNNNDEWVNLTDEQYSQLTFSSTNTDITHLGKGEIKANLAAGSATSTVTFGLSSFTKTATVKIVTESGDLQGIVKDAVTNQPIEDVKITLFQGSLNVNRSTTTSANGQYSIQAPVGGGYRVVIEKPGYQTEVYEDIEISSNNTTYLETVLQIGDEYVGEGSIGGKVVNALDGNGVANITLNLRKGINVKTGEIVANTSTDSIGEYGITNLAAGNYTAEISGTGFNTTYLTIICLGGETRLGQDATISPILDEGETRIVLTWGAVPSDLDSHLTGPNGADGRFHIYYRDKNYLDYADLDLDDTTSYGPETTTIRQQIEGTYRFTVHDYSNRSSYSSYALANSGATVKVYKGEVLVATYYVPANQGGNVWTVFEIEGDTIIPINQMSYSLDDNVNPSANTESIEAEVSNEPLDLFLLRDLPEKEQTQTEEASKDEETTKGEEESEVNIPTENGESTE